MNFRTGIQVYSAFFTNTIAKITKKSSFSIFKCSINLHGKIHQCAKGNSRNETHIYRKISIYISIIINYNREFILQFVQDFGQSLAYTVISSYYQEKISYI